ncbi:MAG: hypothetical protein CHACPFDD_03242 [Phycisphaerae bacterium]|nr:hypothetical protein [Phycisphaerae bacterium]
MVRALPAAGLFVCLTGVPGCRDDAAPADGPLNVLLISIDTTRADHLGCYGRADARTPNIDALAAGGVRFAQCATVTPLTMPSHSSLMTATYPFVHGVRDNGQFQLHAANQTLAEALANSGYVTCAAVGAYVLDHVFGLNQGFATYDDVQIERKLAGPRSRRAPTERSAEEVCDAALGLLRRSAGGPFFLFVHFFDPHQPDLAPERFATQITDPYLAELAYVDEQIGRLLAELRTLRLDRRTLVVVTSDHGEARGQHDEDTHGPFLYDTTMAIPLIFHGAGLPAGRVVARQVRIIDVAPTMLDILGQPPLAAAQGHSLKPLMTGGGASWDVAAYGETFFARLNFGYSHLRMLRRDGWKYVHGPRPELYHVAVDPQEENDLAAREPGRVAELRDELRELIARSPPPAARMSEAHTVMSSDALAKLVSLGYAGGDAPTALLRTGSELELFEPAGLHPRDHAREIVAITNAVSLAQTAQVIPAEKALRAVLDQFPEQGAAFYLVHSSLGRMLAIQNRHEEAIASFRQAQALRPDDGRLLGDLGESLLKLGRTDEARTAFAAAVASPICLAKTHVQYARLLLAGSGDVEAAVAQLQRALQRDPRHAAAHATLGMVFARTGQRQNAIAAYETAVELEPANENFQRELARLRGGP